jgi:type VI secretion system protein ImpL
MLADKSHAEPGHLNDQLTRYWRGWLEVNRGTMPKEQMIRSAERLLTFVLAHTDDPAWPQVTPKLSLLDSARENLRRVVRGTPARERVYADIAPAPPPASRPVTVARIVGEAGPGPGSRQLCRQWRLQPRGLGEISSRARSAMHPAASCRAATGY